MTAIVSGIYRGGKLELLETPTGLREGRVRVVLIEEEERTSPPQYLTYGMFKDCPGPMSTEESFKEAEWHGEEEFWPPNGS
jgi:hypothetical protein